MLSDLAAAVRSTSIEGQIMPGHRLRQKPTSKIKQIFRFVCFHFDYLRYEHTKTIGYIFIRIKCKTRKRSI
jgi:hypothetical protein